MTAAQTFTMSLAKRITKARVEANLTKSDLARAVGVSPAAVTFWENAETKKLEGENLVKIAAATRVDPTWLATGKGSKLPKNKDGAAHAHDNIATPPPAKGRVPVISLIQAGNMKEIDYVPEVGEGDQWEEHSTKLGKRSWAHIVQGDSMDDGSPNSFPEGTIIFVDPDVAPNSGKFVIAKDVERQTATFKKLTTDGAKWYLTPLNRQYAAIEIDSPKLRVIGVVVESRPPSRRH